MAVAPKADDKIETFHFREFAGMNQSDARITIDDKQWFWLENVMPVGKSRGKVVPGPGPTKATIAAGITSMFGFQLTLGSIETPILMTVNNDGSISQVRLDTFVVTSVAGAGSVTTAARMSIYKDGPILIVDPSKGYMSWDGTTFKVIDATKKATDIAVFESRAWLVTGPRAITFTSPSTYNDFTAANGAGSVQVTDAAFPGSIVRLLSALEQLWIIGPGAIDSISSVSTSGTPLVTTFSITNIVSQVGTVYPSAIVAFFRMLVLLTHYGVYTINGATPQKLSDNLDNLFASFVLSTTDQPAAVASIYDIFTFVVLVTMTDPFTGLNRPILVCFARGEWFLAAQGSLTWIASVIAATGDPQVWGTDGTHIVQIFGGGASTAVAYVMKSKLFDFGKPTQPKQLYRFAARFITADVVNASVMLENESGNQSIGAAVTPQNTVQWVNNVGAAVTFVGSGPITWVSSGLQTIEQTVPSPFGNYQGFTLSGTSKPFDFAGYSMQIKRGSDWQ